MYQYICTNILLTYILLLFFSQVDLPEIERLFPNAQVRHIEGSGHWVHSDNPSSFLDTVHAFLDENEKQKHKF